MNAYWAMLLLTLIPLAALSGWWTARRSNSQSELSNLRRIHPEYFKGLNYVLNEQPDKAIEVFVRMLEVDSETVETHLALGNLFRLRGEVDKAIRIHQNLIARPTLDKNQRELALLELGMDYMRLGILDRAEGLFKELSDSRSFSVQAYFQLLDIYQQEKDWTEAITIARRLETMSDVNLNPMIAHFYCEIANNEIERGDAKEAKSNLKRALNLDPKCVRSSLIEAEMENKNGSSKAAIKAYKRVEKQDPEYIPEIIGPLHGCYENLDKMDDFMKYLHELLDHHSGITPQLYLTDLIAQSEGEEAAIKFISGELQDRPSVRGVDHLIQYAISKSDGELQNNLATIKELTGKLVDERPIYKCNHCGFDAKNLHWHCPSCKKWNTVKPVHGVHGE